MVSMIESMVSSPETIVYYDYAANRFDCSIYALSVSHLGGILGPSPEKSCQ